MENLIQIPGFSRYACDINGNLYSLNYKNSGKVVLLKPAIDGGYLKTMIKSDNSGYKTIRVHRVLALAFLGQPNGKEVNHKDGNKLNNTKENLEYCTRSENVKHAFDNGLAFAMKGNKNGNAKLTDEDVLQIRHIAQNSGKRYYGRKDLAKRFGVSEAHIKDIVNSRRNIWGHLKTS